MQSFAEVARAHGRDRIGLVEAVADEARRAWRRLNPAQISQTWISQLLPLMVVLTGAQRVAAGEADRYLDEVLDAQGLDPAATGRTASASLSGIASDGRGLDNLLYQPVIGTLELIGHGTSIDEALAAGGFLLDRIVRTQVADAGRVADLVATTARPQATGYVRMLVGQSCSRCVLLAGRWYRYNAGFQRHPKCDCVGLPGRENTAGDIRTNPTAYFHSLSPADQDRIFTKAGAEAIRNGADINQVVNARRGVQTASLFGRDVLVTTEGTTTRGLAGIRLGARQTQTKNAADRYRRATRVRLMPEQILRDAKDRDDALRLLRLHGYLLR